MGTRSAGVCIWFTGQSGGGKSTITQALVPRLEEMGLTVSVLDVVPLLRKRWWEASSEGKLLRKAYVASHIVHHGGVAIAVTVSARPSVREQARRLVGEDHFLEVKVAPPPEVAAQRKAARGRRPRLSKVLKRLIRGTLNRLRRAGTAQDEIAARPPDLELDTSIVAPGDAVERIVALLDERHLLPSRRV
ncbi:MAG: adenylyl-sulfate kinase [Actinomycetota bacterium]